MPEIKLFDSDFSLFRSPDGLTTNGGLVSAIRDFVSAGNVAVLKNFYPVDDLLGLPQILFEWGKENAKGENHFVVESGVSKRQKTVHHYCAYNFDLLMHLQPVSLQSRLMPIFDASRCLWNALTGKKYGYNKDDCGCKFHPQIIHYPSGLGNFSPHYHPLHPQQIGLILNLSKRGKDFNTGGNGFEIDKVKLEVNESADIGDLVLFPYDVLHWVSFVDRNEKPTDSIRGRWTAILPIY